MELEQIFHTYYDRVYSFTLFRVRNIHDAEDIVSEAFVKVAKNISRYNEKKAAFSTWLFTIVLNEIRTFYRKRRPTLPLEYAASLHNGDEPLEYVLHNEEARVLYAAIARLDERQRNVVLLKYYGEMTKKQIAGILNLTETNVGVILSRSIKKLKLYIEECNESPPPAYKHTNGKKESGKA